MSCARPLTLQRSESSVLHQILGLLFRIARFAAVQHRDHVSCALGIRQALHQLAELAYQTQKTGSFASSKPSKSSLFST